ncbi:MAG: polysaccharide biosynthesis C-terminal domain-containing protein [Holophagales bacterium]|nr:polysaccharide biosynthesis C-terminal domain-containing protein [Holophagales bacterium]
MRSLLSNGISMLAARLLVPVFSFAINVGIARTYGAETLGVYIHLLALLLIFQAAAGAGMQLLLTRELATSPEESAGLLRNGRSFALLSGSLSTLAFLAYAVVLIPHDRLIPAAVLSLTVLPSAWIATQEAFFMATRTHHRITIVSLAENALKLALAFAAYLLGAGILGLCVGIAAARLLALGAGFVLMRRAGAPETGRPTLAGALGFGRTVAPFAVLFALSMLYFRVDVLLVQALRGEGDTGRYGAALTLYSVVLLLPESAMAAVYPRLASSFRASLEGYAEATLLSLRVLVVGIVPLSLFLICFADRILGLAYGERFLASATTLRLLAVSLPLHAVNGVLGQALQAARLQSAMLRIIVFGLATHVVANVVLLPRLGIEGAAVALFLSSSVVALGAARCFHRNVAPLSLGVRFFLSVATIGGPLALALLVPPAWRLAAFAVSLCALSVGALSVLLCRSDFDRVVQSFRAPKLTVVS